MAVGAGGRISGNFGGSKENTYSDDCDWCGRIKAVSKAPTPTADPKLLVFQSCGGVYSVNY